MVETFVEYIGDLRCVARHAPSGSKIDTCAPVDHLGKGDRFSPTDLVAAALATCVGTVLGIYAQKKGWNLIGMKIQVKKEMASKPARRIASLAVEVSFPISLSDEEKIKVEEFAHTCPVHMSIHPDIKAPIIFHWKE